MKSLALRNSPLSVEMETNFQLAPFLRPFVRTCQVDITSLSNLKRANASISCLQGIYHQGKKQSQPLDWEKTPSHSNRYSSCKAGQQHVVGNLHSHGSTLENSFDCCQTYMSLCKYRPWLTLCESQISKRDVPQSTVRRGVAHLTFESTLV